MAFYSHETHTEGIFKKIKSAKAQKRRSASCAAMCCYVPFAMAAMAAMCQGFVSSRQGSKADSRLWQKWVFTLRQHATTAGQSGGKNLRFFCGAWSLKAKSIEGQQQLEQSFTQVPSLPPVA